MSIVYARNAVAVPEIQVCPDDLSLYADPLVTDTFDAIIEGAAAAQSFREKLMRNFVRTELIARHGAGAVGIQTGLTLSGSGLVGTVQPGKANISGPVELATATTIALTDGVSNFLWISQLGTLNKRTSADGTPYAPPETDSVWCYLGMIPVSAGVVGNTDLSGVVYVSGGIPRRRTADATTPADNPPATVAFFNTGASQLWFWNGFAYVEPGAESHTVKAEGGDVSPGALDAKTLAGAGISLLVVTDGGVRKLQISSDTGEDHWKPPCRAASTANVNTASPGAAIDGVSLSSGDRVLLKNQTTGSQNGPWVWNGAAVAMTRPTDFDASSDVASGVVFAVTAGSTQADTFWALVTDGAITLGSTTLTFGQVAAVRHVETFTTPFSPGAGSVSTWNLDFSARGSYLTDFFVRCVPDEGGVLVTVLDSNRTNSAFDFQIQVANDADDGTYGYAGDISLIWTLEGWQWVVGVGPTDVPTLTENTFDFTGAAGGGGSNQGQEYLTADATLDGSLGSHVIDSTGGARSVTLPASPAAGDRHTISRFGPSNVTVHANSGQILSGSGVLALGTGESITFEFVTDLANLWIVVAYVDPSTVP